MIRTVMNADLEAALAVPVAASMFKPEEIAPVREMLQRHLECGAASADIWLCNADSAGVIDAVAFCAPATYASGVSDLLMLAVVPARQRNGLGRDLVARAENELRRRDYRLMFVETSGLPNYSGARDFYAAYGFTRSAVLTDYYDDGDDNVIFVKDLREPA